MSRMVNKKNLKFFADDVSVMVLDHLYLLIKYQSGKKEAEKIIKNIIKVSVIFIQKQL